MPRGMLTAARDCAHMQPGGALHSCREAGLGQGGAILQSCFVVVASAAHLKSGQPRGRLRYDCWYLKKLRGVLAAGLH